MKKTTTIVLTAFMIFAGGFGAAYAQDLSNTMFNGQELAYLNQHAQGASFEAASTTPDRPQDTYANTMLSGQAEAYLKAVKQGKNYTSRQNNRAQSAPAFANTMLSSYESKFIKTF